MKGARYTEEQSIGTILEYEESAKVEILCMPQVGHFQ